MRRILAGAGFAFVAAGTIIAAQGLREGPVRQSPSGATQSRALLRERSARIDQMARTGELRLRKLRQDTILSGRSHERYDQHVNGIRVEGGDVTRQIAQGVAESIFGQPYEVTGVRSTPTLSEDQARASFRTLGGQDLAPGRRVELVILPKGDGTFALTYRTHIRVGRKWLNTYLDAHTGEVVLQYNDLHTQSAVGIGTGVLGDEKKISTRSMTGRFVADDVLRPPVLITYDMQGDYNRVDTYLFGLYRPSANDLASDTDNTWTDGANVDAHVYLGWTYDYYFKRFGRKGLDDDDTPIYAITHPLRRSDYFTAPDDVVLDFALNAFWCGFCGPDFAGAMVFGEGLPAGLTLGGQTIDFFAGALDIVAHELTHGLTDFSSNLIYLNESGALNEAFSDIMGTAVEFFYQQPGSGLGQADYLAGEDIVRPGGIRSMSDPAAFGDPDHYSRRYLGPEDNGGVHINSGIANQAYYLAIEGGVNRTSGLSVQGVGRANREQIERAFYRAFVLMLPSNATFATARAATIQAARDLFGANSPAERAITEAWTAVGVN